MIKIAITGHTSGIGLKIQERLEDSCIGFSRSTGYDINDINCRKTIIKQTQNCDVFINNAHSNFAQTYLFLELFEHWKDQPKQIINIGSRAAHVVIPKESTKLLPYAAQKASLYSAVTNTQNFNCKVDYLSWSYVGIERILQKYPNLQDYISVNTAVEDVIDLIRSYNSEVF